MLQNLFNKIRMRDPVWQAIGVLFAVVSLLVSTVVAYDIFFRSNKSTSLSITWYQPDTPLSIYEGMQQQVKLCVDGLPADEFWQTGFVIKNTGETSIRPSDFIDPLITSVSKPFEIVAVQSTYSTPRDLELKWTNIATNTIQLDPMLLNPGDSSQVLVFITGPGSSIFPPSLDWKARIVGVSSLVVRPIWDVPAENPLEDLFFNFHIYHTSKEMYWLMLLFAFFFALATLFSSVTNRIPRISVFNLLLLTASALLSFSTAEVLVDYFLSGNHNQWWGAYALLLVYLGLLLYFLWPKLSQPTRYIWTQLLRRWHSGEKHQERDD